MVKHRKFLDSLFCFIYVLTKEGLFLVSRTRTLGHLKLVFYCGVFLFIISALPFAEIIARLL